MGPAANLLTVLVDCTRAQVDALLGEVRVDYGRTAAVVEPFLSKLKKALAAIPEHQVRAAPAPVIMCLQHREQTYTL